LLPERLRALMMLKEIRKERRDDYDEMPLRAMLPPPLEYDAASRFFSSSRAFANTRCYFRATELLCYSTYHIVVRFSSHLGHYLLPSSPCSHHLHSSSSLPLLTSLSLPPESEATIAGHAAAAAATA